MRFEIKTELDKHGNEWYRVVGTSLYGRFRDGLAYTDKPQAEERRKHLATTPELGR